MLTEPLTVETALALLREVVAERPAHVYVRAITGDPIKGSYCVYELDGKPSCLVGQVLHRHGVPLARLREFDKVISPAYELPSDLIDEGAGRVLQAAQSAQDSGQSWAEALSAAEHRARILKR